MIPYISPTSLKMFYNDRDMFFKTYVAKQPRMPQTQPMAIGSAFDAYIKSYLSEKLYGSAACSRGVCFDELFESQVEPQNRDWAREQGKYLLQRYLDLGCAADLLLDLATAGSDVKFELRVEQCISHSCMLGGSVPLLGKPDLYFHTKQGQLVVLDWKVNGYCSAKPPSPKPGFLRRRGNMGRGSAIHNDCVLFQLGDLQINAGAPIESLDKDWGAQLAIYSWVLGAEVGSSVIVGIEQIVGTLVPGTSSSVTSYRGLVSSAFQLELINKINTMWDMLSQDWIYFDSMSLEESQEHCAQQLLLYQSTDPKDVWIREI